MSIITLIIAVAAMAFAAAAYMKGRKNMKVVASIEAFSAKASAQLDAIESGVQALKDMGEMPPAGQQALDDISARLTQLAGTVAGVVADNPKEPL